MPIRIVLADADPPILQGLALTLRREPDFEVVACCRNGEEALQAVRQFCPDVLILDIMTHGSLIFRVVCENRDTASYRCPPGSSAGRGCAVARGRGG